MSLEQLQISVKLRLMKPFFLVLAALALGVSLAEAQGETPLSIASVPQRARRAEAFAPRGWKIEKIARGDLNRDGRADAAIVLVQTKDAHVEAGVPMGRQRALVIAFRQRRGWKRVGWSNQLLLGTRGGGAFYGMTDAPVEVSIRKGVVIVGMEFGSREVTATTHRLRWEPKRRAVYLIGMDSITRDRLNGSAIIVSANYLTGVKTTKTLAPNDDKGKVATVKVARQERWLGAVTEDNRDTP